MGCPWVYLVKRPYGHNGAPLGVPYEIERKKDAQFTLSIHIDISFYWCVLLYANNNAKSPRSPAIIFIRWETPTVLCPVTIRAMHITKAINAISLINHLFITCFLLIYPKGIPLWPFGRFKRYIYPYYPFSPPRLMPSVSFFCTQIYRISTGSITITRPAYSLP